MWNPFRKKTKEDVRKSIRAQIKVADSLFNVHGNVRMQLFYATRFRDKFTKLALLYVDDFYDSAMLNDLNKSITQMQKLYESDRYDELKSHFVVFKQLLRNLKAKFSEERS